MLEKYTNSGVWVVIPAAGIGSRMGSQIPKQYLKINSKTIVEHTISRFQGIDEVSGILVVIGASDPYWPEVEARLLSNKAASLLKVTTGGAERVDTVVKGLSYLKNELGLAENQWIMVHDAARPCLRAKDLLNLLEVRESDYVGGILATPVKDTMKRAGPGNVRIKHTESREKLWHALTPQLFPLGALSRALNAALQAGAIITDEASAMEFIGESVALIEGASDNIKLTTPSDLPLVGFLLQQREVTSDV